AMLATVLVSTLLLGWGVKQLLVARLLKMGVLPLVIATIGLSLLIRYSLQQFWTPLALPFPAIFSRLPILLGTIVVSLEEIGNILFAAVVIGALQLFITRTKLGWAMQAVAQNRTLASVLGINVSRLVTITFVLNAALTAIAAILIAPVYLVKYDIGVGLGLKAFYAAIIGGFNQIRGALLGGLLVGVVETLSAAYIILALGLNLPLGYAGQISLCHAAFMAFGSYAVAILGQHGIAFEVGLVVGVAIAFGWGLVLGFPALKVKHHYLAMVTLGFNI